MVPQWLAKKVLNRAHPRMNLPHLSTLLERLSADIYEKMLERSQYLNPEELRRLQEEKVKRLIKMARELIPFYKDRLRSISSLEEFYSLPTISKTEIRAGADRSEFHNRLTPVFGIKQHTSGSTGIPFNFFLDRNMMALRRAIYRRLLKWAGKREQDLVIHLMPGVHPGLEGENIFIKCQDPTEVEKNLTELFRLSEKYPIILQSRVSHLVRLAQLLEKNKLTLRPRSIISYTEHLFLEVKNYLIKVFHAPVFDYYACNEIAAIGQECETHDGFHVNSEWALVEVVNGKGKPVQIGGEGEILVTSFDNEVMPFIRYRIGDRGAWIDKPCPCGKTLPRLRIMGREVASFIRPDGTLGYFSSLIKPIAKRVERILQYQVIRRSKNEFTVRLVPTEKFTAEDKQTVGHQFIQYLGRPLKLQVQLVKSIDDYPSGKQRGFINLEPDYFGTIP